MNLFKKKNKTENISIDSATCTEVGKMVERPEEEVKPILKTEEKPKEEWVWVKGFKGLDYKMCGRGDFQYELGKTYEENDKEIEACRSGFHFCLSLDDVMKYYHYTANSFTTRYFKVKGLVRKSDLAKYGTKGQTILSFTYSPAVPTMYETIDKLAAKSIIILEEIPKEEIWKKYIEPNLSSFWYLTKEKYLTNYNDPNKIKTWAKEILFEAIYNLDITSEDITSMIVEKFCVNINSAGIRNTLNQVLEEIKILNDLDCGKDMKCYLFYSIYSKYIFASSQGNSF